MQWTFVFLVGLLTGLVAFGINMVVDNVVGFKFFYTLNFITSQK
jgi:hypothetical protein